MDGRTERRPAGELVDVPRTVIEDHSLRLERAFPKERHVDEEAGSVQQTVDDAAFVAATARELELATELDAARTKIDNLERALHSARLIGAAIGVVMATDRVTYEAAFHLLATVSQRTQRKLRDIADEVLLTGSWPSRT